MHESVTPTFALVVTGLVMGFGLSALISWLTERRWGIGLITFAVGLAPVVFMIARNFGENEHEIVASTAKNPLSVTSSETAVLISVAIGLILGFWLISTRAEGTSRTSALV